MFRLSEIFTRTYRPESMPPLPAYMQGQDKPTRYPNLFVLCKECASKDPVPSIDIDPYSALQHFISTSGEIHKKRFELAATCEIVKDLDIRIKEMQTTLATALDESKALQDMLDKTQRATEIIAKELEKQKDLKDRIEQTELATQQVWQQFTNAPTFYKQLLQCTESLKLMEETVGTRRLCPICADITDEFYALIPCFHVLCKGCAVKCHETYGKCPSCQRVTASTQKIFFT